MNADRTSMRCSPQIYTPTTEWSPSSGTKLSKQGKISSLAKSAKINHAHTSTAKPAGETFKAPPIGVRSSQALGIVSGREVKRDVTNNLANCSQPEPMNMGLLSATGKFARPLIQEDESWKDITKAPVSCQVKEILGDRGVGSSSNSWTEMTHQSSWRHRGKTARVWSDCTSSGVHIDKSASSSQTSVYTVDEVNAMFSVHACKERHELSLASSTQSFLSQSDELNGQSKAKTQEAESALERGLKFKEKNESQGSSSDGSKEVLRCKSTKSSHADVNEIVKTGLEADEESESTLDQSFDALNETILAEAFEPQKGCVAKGETKDCGRHVVGKKFSGIVYFGAPKSAAAASEQKATEDDSLFYSDCLVPAKSRAVGRSTGRAMARGVSRSDSSLSVALCRGRLKKLILNGGRKEEHPDINSVECFPYLGGISSSHPKKRHI
ncbi:uncharacterized protein LOC108683302 [Hyalella azteca]|uniref:Uncharacterized protein LOC108683302 n=1 Tax=Hyalella azteca TaxID=294128 RepID=A0A8B7PSC0_HYAAZ|nr:uncharacterized protein LOC108683302 [Hyalella azteca]XP_018028093.1 uncharacterized protein LOC108683302 [Hyalella azteca]